MSTLLGSMLTNSGASVPDFKFRTGDSSAYKYTFLDVNGNLEIESSAMFSVGSSGTKLEADILSFSNGSIFCDTLAGIGIAFQSTVPTVYVTLTGMSITGDTTATGNATISGALCVGTTALGPAGQIRATGDVISFYSSDINLKENIHPISNALSKLRKISGVTFDWTQAYIEIQGGIDGYFLKKHDVGVIAQEIEDVLPEIVATRSDGYKGVKYDRLVALLIEAMKEQDKILDEYHKRLSALETK